MGFLLPAAFELQRVTAQESWWSEHSGDVVLALAAVIAAGMAAFVSVRNRQVELAHDRRLRDQEHIRDTLDETVAVMSNAQLVLGNFKAHVVELELFRDQQRQIADNAGTPEEKVKLEKLEKEISAKLQGELESTRPKIQELATSEVRLSIRVALDDPIVVKHELARQALETFFQALLPAVDENRNRDQRSADDGLNEARHEANRAFRAACRAWFNSESKPRSLLARIRGRGIST